jgi:hypothetical protein
LCALTAISNVVGLFLASRPLLIHFPLHTAKGTLGRSSQAVPGAPYANIIPSSA